MDQIKQQLAVVLKYGFWIGTAILLLGSLGVWYMSTGELITQNDSRATRIKGDVTAVTNIRNELDTHPNDQSHEQMQVLIDDRKNEILESWRVLFESQRDILVWPQTFTEDFLREFENKIPIEEHFTYEPDLLDPTPKTLRDQYSDYIKNELPSIAEIAGTEWLAEFESKAGMGGMGGMGMGDMGMMGSGMSGPNMRSEVSVGGLREGPLVEWPVGSQQALLKDVFPWRGSTPSTLEICYSQENLWILRQLMKIIGEVNGDVKQRYQADIRSIKRLSIGKSVRFKVGQIDQPGMASMGMGMGMGGDMDMMMEMEMGGGMDMAEMMSGMGPGGMMSMAKPDPADNRYVDTVREPISGDSLRSALTSDQPSDVNLAVAKRVPVMMSFKMNQKAIPELLATCGSVPLKVEVQQVRILEPDASSSSAMGGGMGGGMGDMGGMDEMDDMGGMGGMGGGMGMGMGTRAKPLDEFPLDVTVEVYGLIFIYNPPNLEALGVEAITAETELSDGPEIVVDEAREAAKAAAAVAAAAQPRVADGNDVLPGPAMPTDAAAITEPGVVQPDAGQSGVGQPDVVAPPAAGAPPNDAAAPAAAAPEAAAPGGSATPPNPPPADVQPGAAADGDAAGLMTPSSPVAGQANGPALTLAG